MAFHQKLSGSILKYEFDRRASVTFARPFAHGTTNLPLVKLTIPHLYDKALGVVTPQINCVCSSVIKNYLYSIYTIPK